MKKIKIWIRKVLDRIIKFVFQTYHWPQSVDKASQILLALRYRELLFNKLPLPQFEDVGFRAFSQNDEDGILLYIFSLIGTSNKKAVEICAGNGVECNSANLIINHGWEALLFDGDGLALKQGEDFYKHCQDTRFYPPKMVHAWIERENVNELISENGFKGEVDLLSLDMDGVDWWIWKSIECIQPRVVVLEYQDIWGPEISVTVPYQKNFRRMDSHPDFCSASLAAFVKLGREKGYRLVGCNKYGFNAFFIRTDIGADILPEIQPQICFNNPKIKHWANQNLSEVKELEWMEV